MGIYYLIIWYDNVVGELCVIVDIYFFFLGKIIIR